jgi:hypothetical protein
VYKDEDPQLACGIHPHVMEVRGEERQSTKVHVEEITG